MPRCDALKGRPDRLPPRRRLPPPPPGYDDPAAAKERENIRAAAKQLSERAARAGMPTEAYLLDLATYDPQGYWPPRDGKPGSEKPRASGSPDEKSRTEGR